MRGKILWLDRKKAVERALSQIVVVPTPPHGAPSDAGGRGIAYRLEGGFNGGFNPEAEHCASWSYGPRTPTADCIGFVLWASGIDRMQPGYHGTRDEWLNCASLLDDAHGEKKFCRTLSKEETGLPGDWMLTDGHIGMVLRYTPMIANPKFRYLVADCSPRHAIDENRNSAINTGYAWSDYYQIIRPLIYAENRPGPVHI
jgi:hypothetical protein